MTELPDELRALGRELTGPVGEDLVDRVLAGIAEPAPRTASWRRWVAALAVLLATIGVSAAVSAPVRAAIVHVLHFGGVAISQGRGPSPAPSPALPGEHRTDLAAARAEVGFAVRVPSSLGAPDSVTVAAGRVVSLYYQRPDGPVRIDEFAGNLGVLWDKYAASGAAERVTVGGHAGLWFADPVTLVYVGPDGVEIPESTRQSDGTLIWIDGDLTLRVDGVKPLDAALAVAAGMT